MAMVEVRNSITIIENGMKKIEGPRKKVKMFVRIKINAAAKFARRIRAAS